LSFPGAWRLRRAGRRTIMAVHSSSLVVVGEV
jgi:hypothetical protein